MEIVLLKIGSPCSNGRDLAFNGKQVGTQHVGRESWFRSKYRIAIPHQIIHGRQSHGPELFHDIPCRGIKGSQGIWIVFTKLFQNMFLVGGVSADVNRFQSVHLQSRVKLVLNRRAHLEELAHRDLQGAPHILPHMSSDFF